MSPIVIWMYRVLLTIFLLLYPLQKLEPTKVLRWKTSTLRNFEPLVPGFLENETLTVMDLDNVMIYPEDVSFGSEEWFQWYQNVATFTEAKVYWMFLNDLESREKYVKPKIVEPEFFLKIAPQNRTTEDNWLILSSRPSGWFEQATLNQLRYAGLFEILKRFKKIHSKCTNGGNKGYPLLRVIERKYPHIKVLTIIDDKLENLQNIRDAFAFTDIKMLRLIHYTKSREREFNQWDALIHHMDVIMEDAETFKKYRKGFSPLTRWDL